MKHKIKKIKMYKLKFIYQIIINNIYKKKKKKLKKVLKNLAKIKQRK